MAKNLLGFVETKAAEPAVIDEFGELSWGDMNQRTNRFVHALRGLGLETGDHVGLLIGNRHEAFTTISALSHTGLVSVPINWHFAAEEVAYVLEDAGCRALVADAEHGDLAVAATSRVDGVEHRIMYGGESAEGFLDFEELLAAHPADEPDAQLSGSTMFYTSGTTGRPKGVKSGLIPVGEDPGVIQQGLEAYSTLMRFPRDGRCLVMAPMYHSGPVVTAAVASALGNTLVLTRRFDPEEMLRLVEEHRITAVYAVPTFFTRLLKLPEDVREKYDVSSVEYVWHTAAPCPPDLKKAMMDWWGPVVHEGYGATEGGIPIWAEPEEWLSRPGTIGTVQPIFELLVIGEDGERLGTGEVGQLYFKSLLGTDFEYHNAPEKTESAHLEPGVFTFGDVGYVDEDGFVFLSDRKIDMVISGGVNIYPAEIESVLVAHPKVADVAVFGIPNDEFGEEVKAVVQPAEGVEAGDELAKELQQYCREHIAGYKVPRSIDFSDELPRTETGKLVKRQLRDPYWEGMERTI